MPNVDELLEGAREAITVKREYGTPIEQEGVTVIPAASVGGGGGDEVSWVPAIDVTRLAFVALGLLVVLRSLLRR